MTPPIWHARIPIRTHRLHSIASLVLALALMLGIAAPPAAAAPASTTGLHVNTTKDRRAGVDLHNTTVKGDVWIFTNPTLDATTDRVEFYLDNPTRTGTPTKIENAQPYDFAGGQATDTTKLKDGTHTLTAVVTTTKRTTTILTATFTVANTTPPVTTTPSTTGLRVNTTKDRRAGVDLHNTTVKGDVWIFTNPTLDATTDRVEFYLDNPTRTGTPTKIENAQPYDFAGGQATDTTKLKDGAHTLTAVVTTTKRTTTILTATFTVANTTPVPDVDKDDSGSTTDNPANGDRFLTVDFETVAAGQVNEQTMRSAFEGAEFDYLKTRSGAAVIVKEDGNNVLRVDYRKGDGFPGHAAELTLPKSMYGVLTYDFKFDESYRPTFYSDTVGGKLPGFGAVGTTSAYSDGRMKPPMHCVNDLQSTDGWSARHMWHKGAGMHQYLYSSDKVNRCGDINVFFGDKRGLDWLKAGRWYTLKQEVDVATGTVTTWLDGTLAARTEGLALHNQPINRLIWAAYINDPGPATNTSLYLDNVNIELG